MITKENLHTYYKKGVDYKYLAREFERDLPDFNSHAEALIFFENLFGKDFEAMYTEPFEEGTKITFARIVHNREALDEQEKAMSKNGYVAVGIEGMLATQAVQIFSDGRVHMVF